MRLSKEEQSLLKKFVNLHYPKGKYDGHIHFSARKGIYLRNIGFGHQDHLYDDISNLSIRYKQDYYLTKNSFTNDKRQSDFLFGFLNIVLDIDLHQTVYSCIPDKVNFLIGKLFEEAPELVPNTVVMTGRGMQLWYALESASYKLDKEYALVASHLCERVDEIFSAGNTTDYIMDKACSCNAASLVRMPFSKNTRANNRKVLINIYHQRRINLLSYIDEYELRKKKVFTKKPQKKISLWRESVLLKLREMRGDFEEGYRDLYLFALYCSCLGEIGHEEAMKKVFAFNQGFKKPLSKKEVLSYLSAAFHKKYRISNQWIINAFHISPKEQKVLNLQLSGESKTKGLFHHLSEEQKEKIKTLADKGYKKCEIAKQVGVDNSTVTRFMKENKIYTQRELFVKRTHKLLARGLSTKETADKLGVSRKEIDQIAYRFRQKQKKREEEINRKEENKRKKKEEKERKKKLKEEREENIKNALLDIHDTVHKEIDIYCKNSFENVNERQKARATQWVHDVYDGSNLSNVYNGKGMKRIFDIALEKEIIPNARKKRKQEVQEEFQVNILTLNKIIKKYHLDPEKDKWDKLVDSVIKDLQIGWKPEEIIDILRDYPNKYQILSAALKKMDKLRLAKQRKKLKEEKRKYRAS